MAEKRRRIIRYVSPELRIEDLKAPLVVAWQVTNECNLSCLHCCEESGPGRARPGEMDDSMIRDVLRQIARMSVPYVILCGGEPFIHPRLFFICRFLSDNGISFKIETSGQLMTKETASRLASLGARSVQVSLDGATPETYRRIRLGGSFEKAVSACRNLVRAGVPLEISFVPAKLNIHEAGEVIDMAASLGAYAFNTGRIMRIGNAAKSWEKLCPTDDQYKVFTGVLEEKTRKYSVRQGRRSGRLDLCYKPFDVIEDLENRLKSPPATMLLLPRGEVKLAGCLPFVCADLRREGLPQAWENFKRAWRQPEVLNFARRVVLDSRLLGEANNLRCPLNRSNYGQPPTACFFY